MENHHDHEQKNYTPTLKKAEEQGDYAPIYDSARRWLSLGFQLLPIQPGTKKNVQGFGIYQTRIGNTEEAAYWFRDSKTKFNLAVIATENKFIIDFDDWGVYCQWLKCVPEEIATTYTEITPNDGAHVFLFGDAHNLQPIAGVEIKRAVLVAPSMVNGKEYEIFHDGKIYDGNIRSALFPLSQTLPALDPASAPFKLSLKNSNSKIDFIKSKISILDLMSQYAPKTILRGHGRYRTACCPFHQELEPSFWIDTQRGLFGCHACKVHGDAINLYAQLTKQANETAIKDLALSTRWRGGENDR